MDAETLVRPVVEGAGLELVEITFGREAGRQVLRVVVDHEEGLDVDRIAAVSEQISRRLDVVDFGRGRYELQVSSPGLERPLKTPAHFKRFVGTQVKVKTAAPIGGKRAFTGTLAEADDGSIVIVDDEGARRLQLEQVASATTVVDWAAELKGSRT
jgi:ribosome maturation factor RimP